MECRRRNDGEKLSVEEYLDFIHHNSNGVVDLTISHLNQIIDMHGFKKLHKTQKWIVMDAVKSIDLMDPTRSTLEDEKVALSPLMDLEEAKNDLAELKWQECSVSSVETLNSVSEKPVLQVMSPSIRKRAGKGRARKVMKLGQIGTSAPAAANPGGPRPAPVGGRREKLVPRRHPWTSVDSFDGISI